MYKINYLTCISHNFYILMFIFLASCGGLPETIMTQTPKPIDLDVWLSGGTCSAPCWYGLVAGETMKDEAMGMLKNISFLNGKGTIERDEERWSYAQKKRVPAKMVSVKCKEIDENCLYMTFINDRLDVFFLNLPHESQITFKDVVTIFGNPDKISYGHINAEGKACGVSLLWVDKQIVTSFSDDEDEYNSLTNIFEQGLCEQITANNHRPPPHLQAKIILFYDINAIEQKMIEYHTWAGFAEGE